MWSLKEKKLRKYVFFYCNRNSQGFEEKEKEEKKEVMETVSETEQNSKSSQSCEETLAYTPQAKSGPSFTYESTMRDETHTAGPAACNQVGFKCYSYLERVWHYMAKSLLL